MDWLWFLLSIILGALLTLGAQALFIAWYIRGAPSSEPEELPPIEEYTLPKELESMGVGGDCAGALSLAMQFLVQELKVAPAPMAWLHRKLSQEMEDILTRTTSGKLLESLTVRSVVMGSAAPCVRWAGVQNIDIGPSGRIRILDLLVDLHYSGGFRLGVDAGMLLGKSACLDIEVEQLTGRARVRFTTIPYTHWSLSFLSPPHLQLRARPLKGRLAALLQAHARRALQRKHTLPNYTIRYKPFFTKIDPALLDPPSEDTPIKVQGTFDIMLHEVTRLFTESWTPSLKNSQTQQQNELSIYCCLSLDSNPWISYKQDEDYSTFTLDIVINKDRTQQLGTVFKQVNVAEEKGKSVVVIETVVPLSAAYKADLRRGDIIIAVDSKLVSTMSQVAKIVRSINRPCFTVRIERKVKKLYTDDSAKLNRKDEVTLKHQDTLSVLGGDNDEGNSTKRAKSNSFSFRKMSEVLETARNVGQEGRALLRGTHSTSNMQETKEDKQSSVTNEQAMSDETQNQTASVTKSNTKSEEMPVKTTNSTPNIISFSKHSDAIQMTFGFGLRKRRCSVENRTSSDSSNSSTPTASSPGTPSKRTDKTEQKAATIIKGTSEDRHQKMPSLESQNSLPETQKDFDRQSFSVEKETTKFIVSSEEDLTENDTSNMNPKISVVKPDMQTKVKTEINEFSEMLQTYTSNNMSLSELLVYNEKLTFKLNRNHRYLNLNVWGKSDASSDDILLAYLNIPLLAVLKECQKSKIGQCIRKFTLLPPDVNLSISKTHPLASHSGFEPCLCYGDILLSFNWLSQSADNKLTKEGSQDVKGGQGDIDKDGSSISGDYETIESATMAIEEDGLKQGEEVRWKSHDFLRTHFHRSTQCDYCGKKIWLKDAVQCRDCAMCCHKKCVTKCLSTGRCLPPGTIQDECSSPSAELPAPIIQAPEFLMTEHNMDGVEDQMMMMNQSSLLTPTASQESLLQDGSVGRNALAGLLGGLRRVGSAHSLAPPTSQHPGARSLPPSPQHTPRRQSPEDECVWTALDAAIALGARGAEQLLVPLLKTKQSPELLLAGARDMGPRLMKCLPPEERAERLASLTTEVRVALDEESLKMSELQSSLSGKTSSKGDRMKQLQTLAECENRSHALTALLLHCCSAMQSINRESISE